MKQVSIIGLFSCCALLNAQRHEVGMRMGTSNVVGDIGKTSYIQSRSYGVTRTPLIIGGNYKMNFNPYQGVRLSVSYMYIDFDDMKAKERYRNLRGSFDTNEILETSLTFEYNFFSVNNQMKRASSMWSPYIFAGVSGLWYEIPRYSFTVTQNRTTKSYAVRHKAEEKGGRFSVGIPLGIGIKYKFSYNWAVYGELTFRPTFTDELDYNNVENTDYTVEYLGISTNDKPMAVQAFEDYIKTLKIGNLNSKDWLNSISVGVSYSFGRPPCYCD